MKQVNIVYEKEVYKPVSGDGTNGQRWITEKAQTLVAFSDLNTRYDEGLSYRDNFEKFIRDSFECGFVFLNDEYAIPVFKILAFMAVKDASGKTDVDRTKAAIVPEPREVREEKKSEPNQNPNQNRGDKRMRRHGRWRNFKKRDNRDNGVPNAQAVPPTPTATPPIPPKISGDLEFGGSSNP